MIFILMFWIGYHFTKCWFSGHCSLSEWNWNWLNTQKHFVWLCLPLHAIFCVYFCTKQPKTPSVNIFYMYVCCSVNLILVNPHMYLNWFCNFVFCVHTLWHSFTAFCKPLQSWGFIKEGYFQLCCYVISSLAASIAFCFYYAASVFSIHFSVPELQFKQNKFMSLVAKWTYYCVCVCMFVCVQLKFSCESE